MRLLIGFFFFLYISLFSQQNFNTLLWLSQTTVCVDIYIYTVQGFSRKKSTFVHKEGKALKNG